MNDNTGFVGTVLRDLAASTAVIFAKFDIGIWKACPRLIHLFVSSQLALECAQNEDVVSGREAFELAGKIVKHIKIARRRSRLHLFKVGLLSLPRFGWKRPENDPPSVIQ